jgi:hypothetical protein
MSVAARLLEEEEEAEYARRSRHRRCEACDERVEVRGDRYCGGCRHMLGLDMFGEE